jgi:SAM-dependent methyltransferase
MLTTFKTNLSDVEVLRKTIKILFSTGDDVRPIVQKPIIDQFIGHGTYRHALDAGCGRGLYLKTLLRVSDKVSAIDYSTVNIDTLRRRLGMLPQLSLDVASADNLVTHCEVLEHIDNDRQVLSELYRVLQPGGRLVLSVPVPPAPIQDAEHVREGYSLSEISELLREAGFDLLRHQYCIFNLSKWVIKVQSWWNQRLNFPLPSIILLPAYWEHIRKPKLSDNNLPYDIVLEAIKP